MENRKVKTTSEPIATYPKFGQKGQLVHTQARQLIANVIDFMKNEADHFYKKGEPKIPLRHYKERAMASMGISEKMYRTICTESKNVKSGVAKKLSTPKKKKQQQRKIKLEVVEGAMDSIMMIKQEFIEPEEEFPTERDYPDLVKIEEP